ncbi:MAG: TetR/AcrR family transcriptional regulator [Deltaproteobacteria bacterium]|nr:TetR/AcrR family transcriptional regulator [Deltaproteobacteria bacterium]
MRTRILDASLAVVREKGYAAATVDDLCAKAGVTKGAFFHHFDSKEALGVAAADYWSQLTGELFKGAPYHRHADPLDRFLGYIDFRGELLQGKVPEFTCLVGTMVQETYETHPAIRDACQRSIFGHAREVAKDIEAAKKIHAPHAAWTAESLALHTQAVLQGSFILAKAEGSVAVAADGVAHLRRYVEFLFQKNQTGKTNQ